MGALHKVQSGETLFSIAERYGVRMVDLIKVNRDTLGALRPGWTLALPANPKGRTTHKVMPAEWLWSIAKLYVGDDDLPRVNKFVDEMLSLNLELLAPKNLKAGMTIRIEQSGTSTTKEDEKPATGDEDEDRTEQPPKPTKETPRRGVDATASLSIPVAKRVISTKSGLQYEISGGLDVKAATARNAPVELERSTISTIKLKLTEGFEVGINDKGVPSITGGMAGKFGNAKVSLEGHKVVFEYEPFKIPIKQGSAQLDLSVVLKLEVEPKLNATRAAIQAAKERVRKRALKHFQKILLRRFSGALASRGAAMATAALVDGPFPIGDLVSLGIGIWTAWEILSEATSMWEEAMAAAAKEPGE